MLQVQHPHLTQMVCVITQTHTMTLDIPHTTSHACTHTRTHACHKHTFTHTYVSFQGLLPVSLVTTDEVRVGLALYVSTPLLSALTAVSLVTACLLAIKLCRGRRENKGNEKQTPTAYVCSACFNIAYYI